MDEVIAYDLFRLKLRDQFRCVHVLVLNVISSSSLIYLTDRLELQVELNLVKVMQY